MEQTLLRTYTIFLLINISCCYSIPPADIVVYPKGFSVSIPDEQGIELFFFYGSIDKVTCNFQTHGILLAASKCNGEKWVLENFEVVLKVGQFIYYWLYVKKDGIGYTQTNNFYNVTDITPYNLPDSTILGMGSVSLPSKVTSKPRLQLSPALGVIEKLPHPVSKPFPPYVSKIPNTHNTPFSQKEPSYSKTSSRTDSPLWYGKTQPSYFMYEDHAHNFGTSKSDSFMEGESNIEPFPLPLNSNRDNPTSSEFNPALHHEKYHKHYEKSTRRSTASTPSNQDLWYWNSK